ncbi:MFS transporter [Methylobacterium sp. NEAU 140]|uniref:MFS transporter n=1 Tax=Methylobacterium sp. NEAU 140 TaxID=3064945 RepID=UPI0027376582|nr:MFS transporter [Methylobacterium sp. NEAU 140]MDP4026164.1 MFS transporter [Methylobacterium sp. NEAU 140]
MIFLCFVALAISAIDRVNLAVAAPSIKNSLGLGDGDMGLLLGAFFWTYALLQIPAGRLIDGIGARAGLAIAVGGWSLFTILTGAMRSVPTLLACRLGLGAGEAAVYPGGAKVIYAWFPRTERGLASGLFDAGPRVGLAIGLPLVSSIVAAWGWEASFYVTGLIGLVWLAAWLLLYRDPEHHRSVSIEQLRHLQASRSVARDPVLEQEQAIPWLILLRHRTIWGMMIGLFCYNFSNYFFITWFPTYLMQAKGLSLAQLGTLGTLPALMSIPGSLFGGWMSDWLLRCGWSLTVARKTCLVGGLLTASVITLAGLTESVALALVFLSISYAGLSVTAATAWTLPADVAPSGGQVATIGGLQNFASNLAGIATTAFTGLMLSVSGGSFAVPLMAAGVICLLGASAYVFLVGVIEPLRLDQAPHRRAAPPG